MVKEWKDVQGYEGCYKISNFGEILGLPRNGTVKYPKLKKQSKWGDYLQIELSLNGTHKKYTVHRLVAKAFVPNPNNLPEVNHKDGCKSNNNASNLEWTTRKGNSDHAFSNGLMHPAKGENGNHKLFNKDIEDIRMLYDTGNYSQLDLAERYNINQSQVSRIITKRRWKHLP